MATLTIIINCCVKVTTPPLEMETDPVTYTQDLRKGGGARNEIVLDAAKPFFVRYPSKIQQKILRKTREDLFYALHQNQDHLFCEKIVRIFFLTFALHQI